MRIAQVSPLFESVPPRFYGGTERVVSYLTEELVAAGHEVTVFATGDSTTSAELIPMTERALRLAGCKEPGAYHTRLVEEVYRQASRFDVIHFHLDYLHLPLASRQGVPHLTTTHGRLDLPELAPLFRTFDAAPLVSISDAQREPLPFLAWQATVYHGLPSDLLQPRRAPGQYLVFLGRFSPEKRPDRAIEIARRAGIPLKVAAKVDDADRAYYESQIKPLMDPDIVEDLGEVGERDKNELLGGAIALLFPIDWPEPFGLVMIEAMACGTPVIAWPRGSVPEIIDEGESGFMVNDLDAAVAAVERAARHDRALPRRCFERRFTAATMAQRYVQVYRRLIWASGASRRASASSQV